MQQKSKATVVYALRPALFKNHFILWPFLFRFAWIVLKISKQRIFMSFVLIIFHSLVFSQFFFFSSLFYIYKSSVIVHYVHVAIAIHLQIGLKWLIYQQTNNNRNRKWEEKKRKICRLKMQWVCGLYICAPIDCLTKGSHSLSMIILKRAEKNETHILFNVLSSFKLPQRREAEKKSFLTSNTHVSHTNREKKKQRFAILHDSM